MRRIIKNLTYDTDKASFVFGKYEESEQKSGFMEGCQLFRKRSGEYFLYRFILNSNSPIEERVSESIQPLIYLDAYEWAKENMPSEEFNKYFSLESDSGSHTCLHTRLSTGTFKKLRHCAELTSRTVTEVLTDLIETHL